MLQQHKIKPKQCVHQKLLRECEKQLLEVVRQSEFLDLTVSKTTVVTQLPRAPARCVHVEQIFLPIFKEKEHVY